MRQLLLFLLTLALFAAALPAADVVENLRTRARELSAQGKHAEAAPLMRDACLLAQNEGGTRRFAAMLAEFATLYDAFRLDKMDLWTALLDEAKRQAVISGDYALECRMLNELAFNAGDEEEMLRHDAVDCALATGDPDALQEVGFVDEKLTDACLKLMDLVQDGKLALAAGRTNDAAAAIGNALKQANALKLPRTEAELFLKYMPAITGADAEKLFTTALAHFSKRGAKAGEARCLIAVCGPNSTVKRSGEQQVAGLRKALALAGELRDIALVYESATLLAPLLKGAEASAIRQQAANAMRTLRVELRRDMQEALDGFDAPANELLRRIETGKNLLDDSDKPALTALRVRAGLIPATYSEADQKRFVEGFKKALAKGGSQADYAVAMAEIGEHHEALPLIVDKVLEKPELGGFALTAEALATRLDIDPLLKLLTSKSPMAVEAAAAALARVCEKEDIAKVRKALEDTKNPVARVYLDLLLARHGDLEALARLKKTANDQNADVSAHACGALGNLGYVTPVARMNQLVDGGANAGTMCRVLGRAPRGWGANLFYDLSPADPFSAARARARRKDADRFEGLEHERDGGALMWRLPRNPAEAREAGMGGVCGFGLQDKAKGTLGEFFSWLAERSRIGTPETRNRLEGNREDPFASLALSELEMRQLGVIEGPQTLTLGDFDGDGRAVCRIIVWPQMGDLTDNVLRAPFIWKYKIEAQGSGIAGIIYRELTVQMAGVDVLQDAVINVPGVPPIKATLSIGTENRLVISAELPLEGLGEGLGDIKTIDIDKLATGTVTIKFKFMENKGELTFPLALVVPPKKDKPDLVAEEIVIEPPVPGIEEEAVVTLRARNMGKSIDQGTVCNCRFTVINPQASGGSRTLGVVIFNSSGWRSGEWREFRARPSFVKDYYMNRYSPSWTLEMGDTEIRATIDADGAVNETDEENNSTKVAVPLYLPDEEARRLAVEELLKELEPVLKAAEEATTVADAQLCIGRMRGILERAKEVTPEITLTMRHIEAAVNMRVFKLRNDIAFARLNRAIEEKKLDRVTLTSIAGDMCEAQEDLLNSGVPVSTDTLNYVRNRVMATAYATKAISEYYGDAGRLVGSPGGDGAGVKNVAKNLSRIDAVLLLARYARDRGEKGEGNPADVLSAAGQLIPLEYAPGLSKVHQALLEAEIKYVDQGFRKEADALNAITDLMDGKEGAQERLNAAVRDVQTHVEAGPFTAEAMKNTVKGWVKGLPIAGPVFSTIFGWK